MTHSKKKRWQEHFRLPNWLEKSVKRGIDTSCWEGGGSRVKVKNLYYAYNHVKKLFPSSGYIQLFGLGWWLPSGFPHWFDFCVVTLTHSQGNSQPTAHEERRERTQQKQDTHSKFSNFSNKQLSLSRACVVGRTLRCSSSVFASVEGIYKIRVTALIIIRAVNVPCSAGYSLFLVLSPGCNNM
jgi:hypothetical protein